MEFRDFMRAPHGKRGGREQSVAWPAIPDRVEMPEDGLRYAAVERAAKLASLAGTSNSRLS